MCATSAAAAVRRKYGKYLPHQRANVDQVPLPFVNDMDTTYEQKGAKRVAINQNGPTLGKRQATGQGVLPTGAAAGAGCFLGCYEPCRGFLRSFSEWPVVVS